MDLVWPDDIFVITQEACISTQSVDTGPLGFLLPVGLMTTLRACGHYWYTHPLW